MTFPVPVFAQVNYKQNIDRLKFSSVTNTPQIVQAKINAQQLSHVRSMPLRGCEALTADPKECTLTNAGMCSYSQDMRPLLSNILLWRMSAYTRAKCIEALSTSFDNCHSQPTQPHCVCPLTSPFSLMLKKIQAATYLHLYIF